jgi:Protein of unknown function (DUF3037)
MQDNHLYEYAIIRLVPKVEREEFINVGVILYCAKESFLQAKFKIDSDKIKAISTEIDLPELEMYLTTWQKIIEGKKQGGTIGQLPVSSRFRWLTATRSTIIQSSKVHPGFCINPEEKLRQLFAEMVL